MALHSFVCRAPGCCGLRSPDFTTTAERDQAQRLHATAPVVGRSHAGATRPATPSRRPRRAR